MMEIKYWIDYGKQHGIKYFIRSTVGGLYGGFTTLEKAEREMKELERRDKKNPWTKGTTQFYIEKAE